METRLNTKKNLLILLVAFIGFIGNAQAQNAGHLMGHEMQHGFILAGDDKFASHLVATGHHSRQTSISGRLSIDDKQEMDFYEERKAKNSSGVSYFLFQAQALDLPALQAGHVLTGHIVESTVGNYEPKNIIVKKASYKVERVFLNIENPFFADP